MTGGSSLLRMEVTQLFSPSVLTLQEFIVQETLPLATIQNAVFEFLRGREDVVVFGAQAVNAYVPEPRMTQDIDLLAVNAGQFAEELRDFLSQRFRIAVRVRSVGQGQGYRLYQLRKSGNRHLVDVRPIEMLPDTEQIAQMRVLAPADLIAMKVIAYHRRRGMPKSGTDWRDLALLLLAFPDLKRHPGPVTEKLLALGAAKDVLDAWQELAAQALQQPDMDDEFDLF